MTARDMGRIYVTGADGFIGSHLVESLLADGHEVTALCLYNSFGKYGWLQELSITAPKNLKLLLGDIRDTFFLQETMKGHQTVLHLASLIAIPYSYSAPQSYVDTNVSGTLNVAQAALQAGVGRLVHTSTSEVYGTARYVPITEEHPLQGQSPYSASKIAADMIVDSFFRSFELPAITLRPFNTFGPRQSMRAVIPTIVGQILAGQKVLHLGSISPTRDFNYVSDTVAAFKSLASFEGDTLHGRTFNAGSGREISIGDLVKHVAKVLGVEVDIVCEAERMRPELSEVHRLLADASKLTRATGWMSKVSLEEGIQNFVSWLKQNKTASSDAARYNI